MAGINQDLVRDAIHSSLRQLEPFLADPEITEIMVTGDGSAWFEKAGEIRACGFTLRETDRHRAVTLLATQAGIDVGPQAKNYTVNLAVGGVRFAGALTPCDPRGTTLGIRKHPARESRLTWEQLVSSGTLSQACADYLHAEVIDKRKNLLLVGNTGSAKTTVLNALMNRVDPRERVAVIEEKQEIALSAPNRDEYLVNTSAGITGRQLVKQCMTMRYDRIIYGETVGNETFDLIRALNSGHDGSATTMHASSALKGLLALEMLYQMSIPPGASIPTHAVRQYVVNAIHIVVFMSRSYREDDSGSKVSERRVREIAVVKDRLSEEGDYELEPVSL
jgi:Flp pilus assembly CpaF family ATPase